jgi:MFS family permease
MAVLSAVAMLPHLLFGLPAGVWVDRLPRRTILVVADVGRALLLGTIPALAILGSLRIEQLYVVAFSAGIMTLLFETASLSLVPVLVGRDNLSRANGVWILSFSVTGTVGPSVAGGRIQLLTAPVAIALDAASFLVSAGCSLLVNVRPGPSASRRQGRVRLRSEIVEGTRALFGDPILAAIATSGAVGAFGGAMQGGLTLLYLVRDLHVAPTYVGLAVATTGIGSVAGALLAAPCGRRLGPGPSFVAGQLLASLAGLVLAAAGGPMAAIALFVAVASLVSGLGPPLYGVPQRTLRQALVPNEVQGRVNATWRFVVFGVQPLGAVLGGVLATAIGLRAALIVGSATMLLAVTWAASSPLRSLRELPA